MNKLIEINQKLFIVNQDDNSSSGGVDPTLNIPPPEIKLSAQEIELLIPELQQYRAIYSPLFRRREQREQSEQYLNGLLLDIENKSIEPMVLALVGDAPNAIRATQQFIGQGAWSDEIILKRHWQEVDQDLGEENGVLIADGSDFPKQGQASVGVKRQWCGQLGKKANCQAGVFLAYASSKGYTLLDRRLYLPKEWVNDETYAERRQKYGVPKDIEFKTKPEYVLEMVQAVHNAGTLRYRWLTSIRLMSTYRTSTSLFCKMAIPVSSDPLVNNMLQLDQLHKNHSLGQVTLIIDRFSLWNRILDCIDLT